MQDAIHQVEDEVAFIYLLGDADEVFDQGHEGIPMGAVATCISLSHVSWRMRGETDRGACGLGRESGENRE